jgi:hypothetical protein
MPGPWEKYQNQPVAAPGAVQPSDVQQNGGAPWQKYQSAPAAALHPAGLPPGTDLPGIPKVDTSYVKPTIFGKDALPAGTSRLQYALREVPSDGSDTGGSRTAAAVQNFGSHAGAATLQPFLHPIDTVKGMGRLAVDITPPAMLYHKLTGTKDVLDEMADGVKNDFQQNGAGAAIPHLLGDLGGNLLGGELMGGALRGAGKVPVAAKSLLAGDVNAPIPGADGMTPAGRYQAAKRLGVSPNAAEATNSAPLNALRHWNEGSAAGSGVYADAKGANLRALTRAKDELTQAQSPLDTETGGSLIQSKLKQPFLDLQDRANGLVESMSPHTGEAARVRQQALLGENQAKLHETGGEQEQAIREAYGDQPIKSLDPMRGTARTILRQNQPVDTLIPHLAQKQTKGILQDIANIGVEQKPKTSAFSLLDSAANPDRPAANGTAPQRPTVGNLLDMRSRLLDVNANNPELVKGAAAADIDRQIQATHEGIARSLPPKGNEAWLKANDIWRDMKETYDDPSSPYYHAVRGKSPDALTQGIGGTSPEAVREMGKRVGDEGLGIVRRGVAERLLGRDETGEYKLDGFGGRLEKMPEENRNSLFGSAHAPMRDIASAYRDIEPFRAAAYDKAPETLVQGVGPQTGSAFRDLAQRIGPEGVGAIQKGTTEKLLSDNKNGEPNFPAFGSKLNKLPEDYRGALFGESPGGPGKLNGIANVSNMLDYNENRSGTAPKAQKIREMAKAFGAPAVATGAIVAHEPVAAVGAMLAPPAYNLMQYGAARLMNSPRFVDWLMTQKPASEPVLTKPGRGALFMGAASPPGKERRQ